GEANTLQASGDVLQFLKRNDEALENYNTAIDIFRQVGDRLGEANTLQAIGSLEDDPTVALEAYQTAQAVYSQIGDRYSQGRNLYMFIAEAYVALKQPDQAIKSLQEAANIGEEINFELLQEYALDKIQSIQNQNKSDSNK
ncbi:MAG: tetratricopeptide repeat protein, partial [Cyanobacteria bacterium P01_C01_bin.118]